MEKDYFDARFDGLEKLMEKQEQNLTSYIGAVSSNVKQLGRDLQEHKESSTAHGIEAGARKSESIVQWLGLVISVIAAIGVFAPLFHK